MKKLLQLLLIVGCDIFQNEEEDVQRDVNLIGSWSLAFTKDCDDGTVCDCNNNYEYSNDYPDTVYFYDNFNYKYLWCNTDECFKTELGTWYTNAYNDTIKMDSLYFYYSYCDSFYQHVCQDTITNFKTDVVGYTIEDRISTNKIDDKILKLYWKNNCWVDTFYSFE